MSQLIEFIKKTSYAGTWSYSEDGNYAGFYWDPQKNMEIPSHPGIYFLLSDDLTAVQKIGKAEGRGGLRQRFKQYTSKKLINGRVLTDDTDGLWFKAMKGILINKKIDVYYYTTPPEIVNFSNFGLSFCLEAHWARSFERTLNVLARSESQPMFLSGNLT